MSEMRAQPLARALVWAWALTRPSVLFSQVMTSTHSGEEDRARACMLMESVLVTFRGNVDHVRAVDGDPVTPPVRPPLTLPPFSPSRS